MLIIFTNLFSVFFKIAVGIIIISTLFLFTNLTTDFYDTAKFLTLLIFVGIGFILLSVRHILIGKITFIRTPLDISLVMLLIVGIVSTITSSSPYVSLLGNQSRVHDGLVALIVYILFYFLLTNIIKSVKEIKLISLILTLSGAVLSILSLIVYFGIKVLPSPWVHGTNFSPTGSSFTTTAVLALIIPFVISNILSDHNKLFGVKTFYLKSISTIFLTLFGVTIILTGTTATYIAASVALVLSIFINRSQISNKSNSVFIAVAATIMTIIGLLSFLPISQPPLRSPAQNFPREVQLDLVSSWKTSVSSFRDSPFWGSGPATYLFNFTNYKPVEFNSTQFWNLRFDQPINEYLLVLSTLGGIGLIALLSLTAMFVSAAYKAILINQRLHHNAGENDRLIAALAVAGLTFFVILAFHASTLVVWVIGLLILASFTSLSLISGYLVKSPSSSSQSGSFKDVFMRIANNVSTTNASEETIKIEALPAIILTIVIAICLVTFYFTAKITLADYNHRLALDAGAQNQLIEAYNRLVEAERLNPVNDLYRTNIAQTNFALANATAITKGPTEASPAGSLTDQDKVNIQTLLQQSIDEGRRAVGLSPKSAVNWEILALLYRQISGVAQNALVFSLDSYGKAIQQDPFNPQLRLNVGGVYYAIQNYDLAIRFFTDSINLKPDFANGYYNLSVALRDKGDLQGAQIAAEQILTIVDANSEDYKLANDYLTDLKNRIASGSAQQAPITPPVAQEKEALEKKALPDVVDLGNKPENITTPSAVKKTPTPTPTPNQ